MNKYNIGIMKDELIKEIEKYLSHKIMDNELREYALSQFYRWDSVDDATLPPSNDVDRIYWLAIYDIIHFHNEPKEIDIVDEDIQMHYKSLLGLIKLPKSYIAFRPTKNQEQSEEYINWQKLIPIKKNKLP